MSGPVNLSDVDRLRARDGENCWLCRKRIDFAAKPNTSKAWSVEHLIAKSLSGPNVLENLVLCHPSCNRILGNRSLKDKIKLRERRMRKLWLASMGSRGEAFCARCTKKLLPNQVRDDE